MFLFFFFFSKDETEQILLHSSNICFNVSRQLYNKLFIVILYLGDICRLSRLTVCILAVKSKCYRRIHDHFYKMLVWKLRSSRNRRKFEEWSCDANYDCKSEFCFKKRAIFEAQPCRFEPLKPLVWLCISCMATVALNSRCKLEAINARVCVFLCK